jgi:hypothetical protein
MVIYNSIWKDDLAIAHKADSIDNPMLIKHFFVLWYWGLNSGSTPWAILPALFLWRVLWDRVSWTICQGWLWTVILLISASWVARITGMSHHCPANKAFWWLENDSFSYPSLTSLWLSFIILELGVSQTLPHGLKWGSKLMSEKSTDLSFIFLCKMYEDRYSCFICYCLVYYKYSLTTHHFD